MQRRDFTLGSQRHHESTVERGSTDGNNNVFSNTFCDFGTRKEEAILLCLAAGTEIVSFGNAIFVREFSDQVGFSGSARFITSDVLTSQEDTVDRDDLSWFEYANITDDKVLW